MTRGSTGNKYFDGAIGLVGATIIILVGIIVMGQLCPTTYQNVANNPQALHTAYSVCGTFWQNASNYLQHLTGI